MMNWGFPQSPLTACNLDSNYFRSVISLCYSFKVRDQVLRPYKSSIIWVRYTVFICLPLFQIFKLCHVFQRSVSYFVLRFRCTFCWRYVNLYLIFSTFSSISVALLAAYKRKTNVPFKNNVYVCTFWVNIIGIDQTLASPTQFVPISWFSFIFLMIYSKESLKSVAIRRLCFRLFWIANVSQDVRMFGFYCRFHLNSFDVTNFMVCRT